MNFPDAARGPSAPAAVVLLGHGTRDERGLAEFRELVALVARLLPARAVAAAHLELAHPSLDEAVDQLAARGWRRITVLPVLLLAAGHARIDIPRAIFQIAAARPELEIEQAGHLGCHPRMLEASAVAYSTAVAGTSQHSAADTLWILVGRGSHDPEAQAELDQFAQLRRALTPVAHLQIGYLSMAQPLLPEVLERAGDLRFRRVVIQPHLLFHGELLARLHQTAAEFAARWPDQEWIVAPHLGPSPDVAMAILDLLITERLRAAASA